MGIKLRSASIPDSVNYYVRPERQVVVEKWEGATEDTEGSNHTFLKVKPVFISDSSNKKTNETGQTWANQRQWDYKTQTWIEPLESNVVTRKNEPFSGVKITGLEHRGNGGRAYKAVDENGYWFDVREDVILDTMFECGIDKDAVLNGEFIWCRIASQMKLVRVGSELHRAAIEANERRQNKVIPKSQLKFGHLYQTKAGNKFLYLGEVKRCAVEWKHKYTTDTYNHIHRSASTLYGIAPHRKLPKKLNIKPSHRKALLVLELWDFGNNDLAAAGLAKKIKSSQNFWRDHSSTLTRENWHRDAGRLQFKNSIKLVQDLGKVEGVTEDIYKKINQYTLDDYEKKLKSVRDRELNRGRTNAGTIRFDDIAKERIRLDAVCQMIQWGTVYKLGDDKPKNYDTWVGMLESIEPELEE